MLLRLLLLLLAWLPRLHRHSARRSLAQRQVLLCQVHLRVTRQRQQQDRSCSSMVNTTATGMGTGMGTTSATSQPRTALKQRQQRRRVTRLTCTLRLEAGRPRALQPAQPSEGQMCCACAAATVRHRHCRSRRRRLTHRCGAAIPFTSRRSTSSSAATCSSRVAVCRRCSCICPAAACRCCVCPAAACRCCTTVAAIASGLSCGHQRLKWHLNDVLVCPSGSAGSLQVLGADHAVRAAAACA